MRAVSQAVSIAVFFSTITSAHSQKITNGCRSCIANAGLLSVKLSPQYRDFLIVKEEICSQLPALGQPACGQLLEAANPVIHNALSQPVQTCERLGACSKKEEIFTLLHNRTVGDDVTCSLCEYIVVDIKEQLKDPETEEQLVEQATELCKLLPEELQAECLQDISKYSQQIFAFIGKSGPEEICELATMCDASMALPELPQSLKEKTGPLFDVQDDDQCNTCKLVIVQASAALADPKTQKEILKYVKKQCSDFQAFQDQCEAYIELYGPLAINMARQYLSPDLCDQLGFCPQSLTQRLQFSA